MRLDKVLISFAFLCVVVVVVVVDFSWFIVTF
jgi:hypothetical protein